MRNATNVGTRPAPARPQTRAEVRVIVLLLDLAVGLWMLSGPVRSACAQVPVTPAPAVPATPTPLPATATSVPVATPAPTAPPAATSTRPPAPVVTPAAPPPTPTRPAPTVPPTPAPSTAPRAGGFPLDLAFGLICGGAATLAAGLALLRRGRRHR